MFLAMDIGNTHITFGLYHQGEWRHTWRWSTRREATEDELGLALVHMFRHRELDPQDLEGIGLVSVVPTLTRIVALACQRYLGREPFVLSRDTPFGLAFDYDLGQLGLDRVANAVAAFHFYGGPTCVVDIGTAITVDAVTHDGRFLGGVIAPGLDMAAEALHGRTAQLPLLRFEHLPPVLDPEGIPLLGHTTTQAMQVGLLHGFAGMMQTLVRGVCRALETYSAKAGAARTSPHVVATGGWAGKFARWLGFQLHPHLTLDGVRVLWERQRGGHRP